jgi:hypothetical protein
MLAKKMANIWMPRPPAKYPDGKSQAAFPEELSPVIKVSRAMAEFLEHVMAQDTHASMRIMLIHLQQWTSPHAVHSQVMDVIYGRPVCPNSALMKR